MFDFNVLFLEISLFVLYIPLKILFLINSLRIMSSMAMYNILGAIKRLCGRLEN